MLIIEKGSITRLRWENNEPVNSTDRKKTEQRSSAENRRPRKPLVNYPSGDYSLPTGAITTHVVAIPDRERETKEIEERERERERERKREAALFAKRRGQAKIHASDVLSFPEGSSRVDVLLASGGRLRDFQADCCRERDRASRHERVVDRYVCVSLGSFKLRNRDDYRRAG